jgi:peptide deformylase
VDVACEDMAPLIASGIIPRMFDLMYENDGVGIAAPQVCTGAIAMFDHQ